VDERVSVRIRRRSWAGVVALVGALVVASGCRTGGRAPATTGTATTAATGTATTAATGTATTVTTASPQTPTSRAAVVEVAYRIERRTSDAATTDFATVVDATLGDPRGWQRAGFHLVHRDAGAPYRIAVAEPDDAEAMCRPYEVFRRYSCQIGPLVVINADRWRTATPQWTGDLATYRQELVNHEVGHLLGQHHPANQCPVPGRPAAVMSQQSTELRRCVPNPWPLDWEIERAARHDLPLAPPFERA